MKKILSIALAMIMILIVSVALAENYGTSNQAHIITVTSQGTGVHNYEAYQVFAGNLNATENLLTDIKWGSGVDGDTLLQALKGNSTTGSAMASADTPAKVAKILGDNKNTAAFVEAFATLVADNLTNTKAGTGNSNGGSPNKAQISVSGDGYYFVKDVTPTLKEGDTFSKFMLDVVKDVSVVAKDISFAPDKYIRKANGEEGYTHVKADSSAVGDIVIFDVEVIIPDTSKYIDHFIMNMHDSLPAGLTLLSVDAAVASEKDVPFTATVTEADDSVFNYPADSVAASVAKGGQKLKIVFNGFKEFVEDNNLIGQKLTVSYRAVVNADATYGPTGNENEVYYVYSTDPNYDYDGDEPEGNDPKGETPKSKTKTVVTQLRIIKIDGTTQAPLANAKFRVSGTAYNTVVVTRADYVVHKGMQPLPGKPLYWKLLDGTYTTTNPSTVSNPTQYADTRTRYDLRTVIEVSKIPVEVSVEAFTNDDGELLISGLKPGTYTVEEINAPEGYNKITETKTIEITWTLTNINDKDSGVFNLTQESKDAGFVMIDDGVEYDISIENNQGTELPSTGGIGTTIFYILGGILLIGAAVILVARRKAQD